MVESGFQFGEPSESALWHFATAVTIRDIVATLLAIRASADIISIRRCWLPAVCFQNVKEGNEFRLTFRPGSTLGGSWLPPVERSRSGRLRVPATGNEGDDVRHDTSDCIDTPVHILKTSAVANRYCVGACAAATVFPE